MESLRATQLLRNDHKSLRGLFQQVQAAESRAPEMREGVIREIFMLLEVHSAIEQEIFYPPLRESQECGAMAEQAIEDHEAQQQLIDHLKTLDHADPAFKLTLEELIASVEEHMNTEELELFPLAEEVLYVELRILGERMSERKEKLMSFPEYRDAQPDRVQDPKGGEQMRRRA